MTNLMMKFDWLLQICSFQAKAYTSFQEAAPGKENQGKKNSYSITSKISFGLDRKKSLFDVTWPTHKNIFATQLFNSSEPQLIFSDMF